MAYKIFAAIDVGSNDVSMKIYQVTARKGFKVLDTVSNMIELGSDTYRTGKVSNESIDELCSILNKFKKKMREYGAVEYRAYATSAVREAENCELILNRIKLRTELDVTVLSNSEHRFMMYQGLYACLNHFNDITMKNTAVVDVGAGSVQISLFDKQALSATQNLQIGSVRVRDYLSKLQTENVRIDEVIEEYISNEIETFKMLYLKDKDIKNVIAIGDEAMSLVKVAPELGITDTITQEQFDYIYSKIVNKNPQDLALEYGLQFERATILVPATIIYSRFLKESKAEIMWLSDITLCDGAVTQYMDQNKSLVIEKDFKEDIIASAYHIAKRYRCNKTHIQNITKSALDIFDCIKRVYGLGNKERLQLELAVILHDCGKFINMSNAAENSYNIIMSTEILGLSHREREEIANIVKYNTVYLPAYAQVKEGFGDCSYTTVAKLSAILRIANAMDRSHKQKINDFSVSLKEKKLIITADTLDDITLETGLFNKKADFFEQVYGIRPVLRQKRSI